MREYQGEYALIVAMIEIAVRDLLLSSNEKDWTSATNFLFTRNDSEPFSFNWICDTLNLDSDTVRNSLKFYIRQHQDRYKKNHRKENLKGITDYTFKRYISQITSPTGYDVYHEFEWTAEDREVA